MKWVRVSDVVIMPAMSAAQSAGWQTLMDLAERRPEGWALVGGQMVHLWCAQRGSDLARPTDDIDTVLDVRARPHIYPEVTAALKDMGLVAQTTPEGIDHRWVKGAAEIDVLVPRHLGARAANRRSAFGGRALETPGAQKVLNRTETVLVDVEGRVGSIPRPTLLGSLVAKAAAYTVVLDRNRNRHLGDLVVLGSLLVPNDVRDHPALDRRERRLLSNAIGAARADPASWGYVPSGAQTLDRMSILVTRT